MSFKNWISFQATYDYSSYPLVIKRGGQSNVTPICGSMSQLWLSHDIPIKSEENSGTPASSYMVLDIQKDNSTSPPANVHIPANVDKVETVQI